MARDFQHQIYFWKTTLHQLYIMGNNSGSRSVIIWRVTSLLLLLFNYPTILHQEQKGKISFTPHYKQWLICLGCQALSVMSMWVLWWFSRGPIHEMSRPEASVMIDSSLSLSVLNHHLDWCFQIMICLGAVHAADHGCVNEANFPFH